MTLTNIGLTLGDKVPYHLILDELYYSMWCFAYLGQYD